MPEAILILITCASTAEAEAIARELVTQRLVACASIGAPVRSHYRWQGKLETSDEVQLWLKARREHFPAVEAKVRAFHSYDVPEIVALPIIAGSAAYLKWLDSETDPAA